MVEVAGRVVARDARMGREDAGSGSGSGTVVRQMYWPGRNPRVRIATKETPSSTSPMVLLPVFRGALSVACAACCAVGPAVSWNLP